MDQSDVENMVDLTDKNVKILPPNVEELKRQVSYSYEKVASYACHIIIITRVIYILILSSIGE